MQNVEKNETNVKKNFGYQLSYQILLSILPFITSPYIARVLGADGVGIYAYTFSIITYFKIFAALGISNYGNRLIAKSKDKTEELNRKFTSLLVLHVALTGIVTMIYVLYWLFFVKENRLIAIIQILYLVAEMWDVNWFFFGMEKFKLTVTRNAFIKLLSIFLIFSLVKSEGDLWKYVLILACSTLFSNLVLWLFLPRYVRFSKFPLRELISHIKPMFTLFFAVIAISVFSYMDKIMIGTMSSKSQLGIYENAWKMIDFPTNLVTALGTVMLPKMSYLIANGRETEWHRYLDKAMRFSLLFSVAIAFGVAGISNEFAVMFWGNEFKESGMLMLIMSPVIILMAFNAVIRNQYLIPKECDKIYLLAVSLGAIINFIINMCLIPIYGAAGAGFATLLSYAGIWTVQTLYVHRHLQLKRSVLESMPYAIFSFIMFLSVKAVGNRMGASVIAVILEVCTGVIIFGILSLFYAFIAKDKFILDKVVMFKNYVGRKRGKSW